MWCDGFSRFGNRPVRRAKRFVPPGSEQTLSAASVSPCEAQAAASYSFFAAGAAFFAAAAIGVVGTMMCALLVQIFGVSPT